ncbi:hypothetical protein BY458DRAFT_553727 [Sporodiniella umbellata]|nr:hypothetical protein BY458DRAFT_553727 [Sporodiniella umbellata]
MKAVCIEYKGSFDSQYVYDLENNLNVSEFHSIIQLFNQAAFKYPLPISMTYSTLALFIVWIAASVVFYFIWLNAHISYLLLGLPLFMISTLFSLVWYNKKQIAKFEDKIIETCTRLNATENIRGIHFKLMKDGLDVKSSPSSCYISRYTLVIELDDRFNALKSREFREWITWPKTAYSPYEKDPVYMFQEQNEKAGYLV